MKVRFFISSPDEFVQVLQQQLEQNGHTVVFEGSDVDLIHIFGAPTRRAQKVMNGARSRLIPVLWSPMRTSNKWMLRHATAVHVWGAHEQEKLQKLCKEASILLIKNPVVTNDITESGLLSGMLQLYDNIAKKHDEQMRADIEERINKEGNKEEELHHVLFEMLYTHYLFLRHAIPVENLKNLSELMIASNYNEDEMANLLKKLKVYNFIASLEVVLEEEADLTEGFEPIPCEDNRLTKKIRNVVIKQIENTDI